MLFYAALITAVVQTDSTLALGVRHEIASRAFNAPMLVDIHVPASYRVAPARRYPVLYVLDGVNLTTQVLLTR